MGTYHLHSTIHPLHLPLPQLAGAGLLGVDLTPGLGVEHPYDVDQEHRVNLRQEE